MPRIPSRPIVRWLCLPTIALMLLPPFGAAAPQKPHRQGMPRAERHESRQEILQLEEKWKDAVIQHNVPAMDGLLAEDYIGITSNGMLESKEQTLENMKTGVVHLTSIEVSDLKVRFYGRTAVVTSMAEVKGEAEGGDASGNFRYTRVYVHDGSNGWRIVSFEASRIREPRAAK